MDDQQHSSAFSQPLTRGLDPRRNLWFRHTTGGIQGHRGALRDQHQFQSQPVGHCQQGADLEILLAAKHIGQCPLRNSGRLAQLCLCLPLLPQTLAQKVGDVS